ncbi:hypothetical protein [Flagellimonas nanhaiensis]|uniref:Uncharacterized protein n=1 Tax=Flagellimonas nanhaiensis TaxID=2292706 RepID=A0A371JRG1_9FLAO|nr:hypothetical protein [Allomuricauda nanhaiensis]RDY60033.1 hypothetical protein DX873_11880 [Allomuricauda nanhaiensis]
MNKFIAIGTALLIFFQSINLHFSDLVELDELVEHYQFHSKEYGDDFMVFLSKHYGKQKSDHSQKHQEEQKDHENLPFQHNTQCSQLLVFVVDMKPMFSIRSDVPSSSLDNFHYYISYSPIWGENPFQPPKQA